MTGDERLQAMDDRLERVERTVQAHTRTLDDHTRTLDEHTRTLDDHTRKLDRLADGQAFIIQALDRLEEKGARHLEMLVEQHRYEMQALREVLGVSRPDEHERRLDDHEKRITRLEAAG